LRTNNFAGFAFDFERLMDLQRFLYDRGGPEHEFVDPELEALRHDLRQKCSSLTAYLARNTWRVGPPSERTLFSVPPEWETDQPERFERVVTAIHSHADAVCDVYNNLIRTARRKLS
jgi:hypothetical protein